MTTVALQWPSRSEYLAWRLAEMRDLLGVAIRIRGAGNATPAGWVRETVPYGPDRDQRMVLTTPDPAAGAPGQVAALFVHGGSWRSGAPEDYGFVGTWFARRGIPSAVTGYRHVPENTWPAQQADVLAALSTLRRRTGASRLVLSGHSAGAQLAAAALYDRDARREAGIQDADIAGLLAMSGPLDFGVICPDRSYCPLIAQLMDGLDDWESADPAALLRDGDAWPVLALHGRRDPLVNVASAASFAAKAGEAGAPSQLVLERDLGHAGILRAFLGDRGLESHVDAFLDRYAGHLPGVHTTGAAAAHGKDES